MPGCVLRVAGSSAAVRAFASRTSLPVIKVFIKGQPVVPGSAQVARRSGININVSSASGYQLSSQVRDAQRFIRRHLRELRHLTRVFKRGTPVLDFGLLQSEAASLVLASYSFPASLIELAGSVGLGVMLSVYPSSDAAG